MKKNILFIIAMLFIAMSCAQQQEKFTAQTQVSIVGEEFYINSVPTFEGLTWRGYNIQGLLPNSRMVNATFDDKNSETVGKWAYPDTKVWDADRNTDEFIAQLPNYRRHNLLAVTLNMQGGDPIGYHPDQPWINTAFNSDGSIVPEYANRIERVIEKADELGMVVILGVFYCAQEKVFQDEQAIKDAVVNTCNWILGKGYKNVVIEIGNESDILFQQPILLCGRVHELIDLAKSVTKDGERLLVSTSYMGGTVPDAASAASSDFILIHGNKLESPDLIVKQVNETRALLGKNIKPIVYNEDDNYKFDEEYNNFTAATSLHASWGYFDYRKTGDALEVGFQSVPVDWSISTERKKGFFDLIKEWDSKFAYVKDGQFIVNNKPHYFIGTNFWYGPILGSQGEGGNRERLLRELDSLKMLGVTNLRVLVGADGEHGVLSKIEPTLQKSPGVYNEELLDGLDYFMAELGKRDMHAVLFLNNSWEWSGGYSQYQMWAGEEKAPQPSIDGYSAYMKYVSGFVRNEKAKELFANHVKFIISRTNKYTGVKYIDDPAIFSWQIGNEPRAFADESKEPFVEWIGEAAKLIRSIDPNHMISTGSEGEWGCQNDMNICERIHAFPEISYINMHIWPFNWKWLDSEDMVGTFENAKKHTLDYAQRHLDLAERLNKPVALEEFGLPRDGKLFSKDAPTVCRNKYYQLVFDLVVNASKNNGKLGGCNFWAWGGMVTLSEDNEMWRKGDDYSGDPAQEAQGLNSVFMSDDSTIAIIKEATAKLK